MRRLLATLFTAAAVASPVHAAIIKVDYNIWTIGYAATYGFFGYYDEATDTTYNLTGEEILSVDFTFDFIQEPGTDITTLFGAMLVPVIPHDPQVSPYLSFGYEDLTELSPGYWHYDFSTNDIAGIIRAGRFSIETYGVDSITGGPISLPGQVVEGSGWSFTVNAPSVPEPTSLALLAAPAALLRRRK